MEIYILIQMLMNLRLDGYYGQSECSKKIVWLGHFSPTKRFSPRRNKRIHSIVNYCAITKGLGVQIDS